MADKDQKAEKAKPEHLMGDEEAVAQVEQVQAVEAERQRLAAEQGYSTIPSDHITVGYIPDPEEPEVEPPATTK